jgi:hypothetical protein
MKSGWLFAQGNPGVGAMAPGTATHGEAKPRGALTASIQELRKRLCLLRPHPIRRAVGGEAMSNSATGSLVSRRQLEGDGTAGADLSRWTQPTSPGRSAYMRDRLFLAKGGRSKPVAAASAGSELISMMLFLGLRCTTVGTYSRASSLVIEV